jgi:hypothetical protein
MPGRVAIIDLHGVIHPVAEPQAIRPDTEPYQFPLTRFPLPPPEAYAEAGVRLAQTQSPEEKVQLIDGIVSSVRGSYLAFEKSRSRHRGDVPDMADRALEREFDQWSRPIMNRADSTTCWAIDAAVRSVRYHDDDLLLFVQEQVLELGCGRQMRAHLAEYLHPYQTGAQPVPTPEERIQSLLGTEHPVLYIRQTMRNLHSVRHTVKPFQVCGKAVLQLSALDELMASRPQFSLRWGLKVDWDDVGNALDLRTAQELEQVLSGHSVEQMGKTNYNHFRQQLPRIRKLVLDVRRTLNFD